MDSLGIIYFIRLFSILSLVDIVGRPWLSPTVPIGNYSFVILTPSCGLLLESSEPVVVRGEEIAP